MKNRRRKLSIVAVLLLVTVGFGAWAWHFQPKWTLARYQQQLIAAGEKLTLAEVTSLPTLPEENSANIFNNAMLQLGRTDTLLSSNPPFAMRMMAPGKALVQSREEVLLYFHEGKTTNTWAEVDKELAESAEAIELLHQIIDRPKLDFMLDYSQGFTLPLPHLRGMKVAAQRLQAAMLSALHRGDTAAAVKHARAMTALVKGTTDERLAISLLVRIALAMFAAAGHWELLQSSNLTDAQLAGLQRDWEELRFVEPYENALLMERAMGELTVTQMQNSSAEFQKITSILGQSSSGDWLDSAKIKEIVWRVSWSYTDHLRRLKGDQVLIDCARMVRKNGDFAAAAQVQTNGLAQLGISQVADLLSLSSGDFNYRTFLSQSLGYFDRVLLRVRQAEALRQFSITTLALKRYHLGHGEYPADLKKLTPEFLTKIPHDPADGQPLRYRREGKNFVLYSVGENSLDEGGNPNPANADTSAIHWDKGFDWVWPQPASPEEVAARYAEVVKENVRVNNPADRMSAEARRAYLARYGKPPPGSGTVPTNAPSANGVP